MPRGKVQKFKLLVKDRRKSLNQSVGTAKKALAAGEKALARAVKKGDAALIKVNTDALRDNKKTLESLEASLQALNDAPCVDQFLNSDPTYEG